MKRITKLMFAAAFLLILSVSVFAETTALSLSFGKSAAIEDAYGQWVSKNGRLYQMDTENRLAKINAPAEQLGVMQYEFDVRYEGGGIEDLMGGFGLHIFVDDAHMGKSWGNGRSYLLWLNFDPDATYGGQGFRAQVYKSEDHNTMSLLEGYDLPLDAGILTVKNAKYTIPLKIVADGNSGLVKVYDPMRENYYYKFKLDEAPRSGQYVAFRTNSLSVSFDNVKITRIK